MKILCINNIIDSKLGGGTATRTKQLSKFLAEKSHTVELLSLNMGDLEDSKEMLKRVKVTLLKTINERFYFPAFSDFHKIESSVKESDLVHMMNHWTFINIVAGYYARKHSIPYLVCPAGALRIFGRSKIIKKIFNFTFGNHLLRKASSIILINKDEASEFKNNICYENQVISIIPNGIDQENYRLNISTTTLDLPSDKFVLFLGRLNQIKGPDILFNSFASVSAKFPELNLVFAGPDEGLKSMIEKQASMLGLSDRVYFTGFLDIDSKREVLSKCTMLVIPSRKEAMSIVVLEGAVLKKPVVFTNACGVDDFELNNIGITTEVSVESIAKGIEKVLSSEINAEKIALDAYEFTIKHYSWNSVVEKHIQLFEKIIY